MSMRRQGLLFVLTFASMSCAADVAPIGPDVDCVHDLTYEGFADGFVRNNCRGCHSAELTGRERHGAPRSVNLGTLEDLMEHGDDVLRRATGPEPSMPPAGGPSDEERLLFREFLLCEGLAAP